MSNSPCFIAYKTHTKYVDKNGKGNRDERKGVEKKKENEYVLHQVPYEPFPLFIHLLYNNKRVSLFLSAF